MKPWLGNNRNEAVAGTVMDSLPENLAPPPINEAGVKVLSYNLFRAWVSEFQALPDLDAAANGVAITTIKIEYEWFERDAAVSEAAGPARIG